MVLGKSVPVWAKGLYGWTKWQERTGTKCNQVIYKESQFDTIFYSSQIVICTAVLVHICSLTATEKWPLLEASAAEGWQEASVQGEKPVFHGPAAWLSPVADWINYSSLFQANCTGFEVVSHALLFSIQILTPVVELSMFLIWFCFSFISLGMQQLPQLVYQSTSLNSFNPSEWPFLPSGLQNHDKRRPPMFTESMNCLHV